MKHLLIDYENIQPQNLDRLSENDAHVWLFLGSVHKNLPIELVQSLLRFGERTHFVRLNKTGKNALDFYLSYYLGQITTTDAHAEIAILSRDGGYDVLLEHILETQQAQTIIRLADLADVQRIAMKAPKPTVTLPENSLKQIEPSKPAALLAPYFQAALKALRQENAFRPSKLVNLHGNLKKYILADLFAEKNDEECELTVRNVLNKLKAQKLISVDEAENVLYHVADADLLARIEIYILSQKPKTYADFQAAVKKRAAALALDVNDADIQAFALHLRGKNLIQQNSGKIEYPPFKTLPEKVEYQPDEAIWKQVQKAFSVELRHRPRQVNTLKNHLKALVKCDDAETENLINYLIKKKYLKIDEQKIDYLK